MATMPDNNIRVVHDPPMAPASADLADAVAQGVRGAFGALSLGIGVAVRALGEPPGTAPRQPGPRVSVSEVADLVMGTAWGAARLSGRVMATGSRITAPVVGLLMRPPLVPRRLHPAYGLELMVDRWQRDRPETVRTVGRWSATALPGAVEVALGQVDIEQLAAVVLDRVDVEQLAAVVLDRVDVEQVAAVVLDRVDVDQVAAVVLDRVDVEQVAAVVLDRVNLDALVGNVVRRLDVTAVTLAVLKVLDLTAVASAALESIDLDSAVNDALGRLDVDEVAARLLDQLDVDEVAARLLDQLDLTQLVLDRVDLERVVAGALARLDLTTIVVDQVDLGGVVSAALQQVDLTAIVMQQVDLLGVAEYVVDGIDLPEIIRDSTGSVASEAVVGLRLQGVDADQAVGRAVDRILRRRRPRRTDIVLEEMDLAGAPPDPATGGPE